MSTIQPNQFSVPPLAAPVAKTAAGPAGEPYVDPLLDKFGIEGASVPCPFWRAELNMGLVHPDEKGNITIPDARQALSGGGAKTLVREGAILGVKHALAQAAGNGGVMGTLAVHSINLFDLRNGPFMHNADTGILHGGFQQDKLDKVLSYSTDGENITLDDLARAQADRLKTDPGAKGQLFGAAEMTLLLQVFGEKNADGDRFLSKKDITTVYKEARFPDGWESRSWGGFTLVHGVREFDADQQKIDGPDKADKAGAAAPAARAGGVCPFLSGQPVTPEEAAKQHADKALHQ